MTSVQRPQRPKRHRLDERSIVAFRAAAPERWLVREKERDYGVDLEVEVFDGDVATGLMFYVQMKSTAEGAPAVSLSLKTRAYYKDLSNPTLIVFWRELDNKLWFKWSHLTDLYGLDPAATSLRVRFDEAWVDESPALIEAEARSAQARKDLARQMPIFWRASGSGEFLGAQRNSLLAALRRRLGAFDHMTERPSAKGATWLEIDLRRDSAHLRVWGGPGGEIHYSDLDSVDADRVQTIAADIVSGIAYEFGRLGASLMSAKMFESVVQDSYFMAADPDMAGLAIFELSRHSRVKAVMVLLGRTYFENDIPNIEAGVAAMDALLQSNPGHETKLGQRLVKRLIAEAELDPMRAGEYYYNAGNWLRRTNPERAQELYEDAAKAFPGYRRRGYWWKERAGISFHQGNFAESASRYRRAIRLGVTGAEPLLAHSLMFAGKYAGAISVFKRLEYGEDGAFWHLTHWALLNVVKSFAIKSQQRDIEGAAKLADGEGLEESQVLEALGRDLLNANALEKWGHLRRDVGDSYSHLYALAAVVVPQYLPGWYQAFATAFEESREMVPTVLMAGLQSCGAELKNFFLEEESLDDGLRDLILKLLDELPLPEPDETVVRVGGKPIR